MLTKLIYINLGVFIFLMLLRVLFFFFRADGLFHELTQNFLMVPTDLSRLLVRPWTVITYMFLHIGFIHILFNLLWLYWFGMIFMQYFNQKQLVGVYLWGGLAGATLYILTYNLFPVFSDAVQESQALGASAAVTAVVGAAAFYAPNHRLNLLLIGPVKIIYIALFFIITDIMTIPVSNAGGHIAHIGGALFGYLYVSQIKTGTDMTKGINRLLDTIFSWFKPRQNVRVKYKNTQAQTPKDDLEYNYQKKMNQQEVDKILDKIAKHGYDSLTKREKEILFKAGK